MLAASSLVALGFAAPAFAADDTDPLASMPAPAAPTSASDVQASTDAVVEAVDAAVASTAETLEGADPVVAIVESGNGNVDVSVRVSSPDADAVPGGDQAKSGLISEETQADITSSPEPDAVAVTDASDTPSGDNVNVSVRVLSPGSDGDLRQDSPLDMSTTMWTDANERSPVAATTSGPRGVESADGAPTESQLFPESAEQYQGENSQYQSNDTSEESAWRWLWYLSVDCAGNAISTSSESGAQSASVWAWEWTWDWFCNSPPRPPPLPVSESSASGDSLSSASPEEVDRERTDGTVSQGAEAPWVWTWTFTFCGETATTTLPLDVATTLQWSWTWTWNWTCSATEQDQPAGATPDSIPPAPAAHELTSGSSGEGQAGGAPGATGPSQAQLALVLPPLPTISLLTGFSLPLVLPFELPTPVGPGVNGLTIEVGPVATLSLVVSPGRPGVGDLGAGSIPNSPQNGLQMGFGAPLVHKPTAPAAPGGSSRRLIRPIPAPATWDQHASTSAAAGHRAAEPEKRHRVAARPAQRPILPELPLPLRAAGASGASAGFVPSGAVVGAAAVIGFLFLTAPGLVRRVRAARELSPRGIRGSSIDHPG